MQNRQSENDSLKRLIQASATGDLSGAWSQAMTYDGFGNLTQKVGSNAPSLSIAVDPATNRLQTNASYDANGNLTGYAGDGYGYDGRNRMIQANPMSGGTVLYGYDTTNHRIYKSAYNNGGSYSAEEIYFYGVEGHKYGTWRVNPTSGVLLQASVTKPWFGPRLVSPEDRLGSKGKYFAFGEERPNVNPANPPNDQEKFATYTRDAATGLDYADQRYYSSTMGRFTRPDPFGGSASAVNPQNWNRYTYANNDPVNRLDPAGTDSCGADFCTSVTEYASAGIGDLMNPSQPQQEMYLVADGGSDITITVSPLSDDEVRAIGITLFRSALLNVTSKINRNSADCQADLDKLNAIANRPLNFDSLIQQTNASADYVYDGATSPTPWTYASFGDASSGNTYTPGWTVGNEFQSSIFSLTAISQRDGNAIFVNSSSIINDYGNANVALMGLATHEAIHKFGISDESAKAAFNIPPESPSDSLTVKLGHDCFN